MTLREENPLQRLVQFLDRLEKAKIFYRIEHIRDSILAAVAVPGERWEVEFFPDGHIEVERFRSDGAVEEDESLLDALISQHGTQ